MQVGIGNTLPDEDKDALTDLIHRAFRAQRMGNAKDCEKNCRLVSLHYGEATGRSLRRSLRQDKYYVNNLKNA